MINKETGPDIFQQYLALTEDTAMRPFLEGMKMLFENLKGHEEEIGLLLELINGRLGTGIYARKKEELAKKLGFKENITERYLSGMRSVRMGRKFYEDKPRQVIEVDQD